MTSHKSPAFQFYPGEFLTGTVATYSLEEIGVYITLLAYDWSLDGLPLSEGDDCESGKVCPKLSRNSLQTFAKLCRTSTRKFERFWSVVGRQFVVSDDGRMRNPRLQSERTKQVAYSAAMAENGKLGGRPRKPSKSRGLAAVKPDESSLSLSSSTSTTSSTSNSDADAVAAHYLERHPRRRLGDADRKALRKALAVGYTSAELCAAIDGNASDKWHRDKKKHEMAYVLRDTGTIDNFREKAAQSALPLVDEHGVLTEHGDRETSPDVRRPA